LRKGAFATALSALRADWLHGFSSNDDSDGFGRILKSPQRKVSSLSKLLESAKHPFSIYRVEMYTMTFARKEVVINISPNRHDNDPVLIVTTDTDLGDGRTLRMSFARIVQKSQSDRFGVGQELHCSCYVNQNLKLFELTNSFIC
jgi:hypothetical protein